MVKLKKIAYLCSTERHPIKLKIFNFLNTVFPGPIILFFLDGNQYLIVPEASLRQLIRVSRSR